MLSQIRSTRYAVMAMAIVTGLMFAAPPGSEAAPLTATFEITVTCGGGPPVSDCPSTQVPAGTEAGKLTGSFTGDPGSDDIIDETELTDLKVKWTPNPNLSPIVFPPPMFERMLSDVVFLGFMYTTEDFVGPTAQANTIIQLDLEDSNFAGFLCRDTSTTMADQCIPSNILQIFPPGEQERLYSISQAIVMPEDRAVVPEPGTWLLLGTGLVGMLGYACCRRVRPATLRRDPGADA